MSSDEVINQIIRAIVDYAANKSKNDISNQVVFEKQQSILLLFNTQLQNQIQNYQITDTLAAFMIRAVALDPFNKFNIEMEMSRDEVERLIKVLRVN